MIITPLKTPRVTAGAIELTELVDNAVGKLAPDDNTLQEGAILAITSKVVALCEGSTVPMAGADKDTLISQQAQLWLPRSASRFNLAFTITNHTLIPTAGIDESNGDGHYVLWPRDAQKTANQLRRHLAQRFGLQRIGIVITDSTSQPLRRGTIGIALAHSGFACLHNYVGQPDLFGRPISVSQSNTASGLAAAAVLAMGEGSEQTPLCLIGDVPFVTFQDRDPTDAELAELRIGLEDDLFAPFLTSVPWQRSQNDSRSL